MPLLTFNEAAAWLEPIVTDLASTVPVVPSKVNALPLSVINALLPVIAKDSET